MDFIDLRSPREFLRDHVPGARNVPLLDNQGRAAVGLLYHKKSPESALAYGLRLVERGLGQKLEAVLGRPVSRVEWGRIFQSLSSRLGSKLGKIRLETNHELASAPNAKVVYCWRGGMRSSSMAGLLNLMGEGPVAVLEGGYKAYRGWVMERASSIPASIPLLVLRGPTGVGKTDALRSLERVMPGSTLDLEGMAQHRSSALGDIGTSPVSQPAFESAIVSRLEKMSSPPWFIEGESRKVGDVQIPLGLFQAMERGDQIQIEAPLEWRVDFLGHEYLGHPGASASLAERLPFLESRMGPEWSGRLTGGLALGRWREVAKGLLENYYDPLYLHHDRARNFVETFRSDKPGLVGNLISLREQEAALAPPA